MTADAGGPPPGRRVTVSNGSPQYSAWPAAPSEILTKVLPWALAAAVGLSRVYRGAHFPLDVDAGAALGMLIGGVLNLVFGVPGASSSTAAPTDHGEFAFHCRDAWFITPARSRRKVVSRWSLSMLRPASSANALPEVVAIVGLAGTLAPGSQRASGMVAKGPARASSCHSAW